MWWLAAMAAYKAASSIVSSQQQAGQQARDAREASRRLQLQHAQTLGETQVAEGASGVAAGSSLQLHLNSMTSEFKREEDWQRRAGMTQASATRTAGLWGGTSDMANGMTQWGQASNWWQQPQSKGTS